MHPAPTTIELKGFGPEHGEDPAFRVTYQMIERWTSSCELDRKPKLPQFKNHRIADNFRPLIAIADALGYGPEARAAPLRSFNRGLERTRFEIALFDVKAVFETFRWPEQLASRAIVEELKTGRYEGDYRGLSQKGLSALLAGFDIHPHPHPLWPSPRPPSSKSFRGYLRSSFERAWETYGDEPSQPSQTSKIKYLRDA
jgi:hypothetical protein